VADTAAVMHQRMTKAIYMLLYCKLWLFNTSSCTQQGSPLSPGHCLHTLCAVPCPQVENPTLDHPLVQWYLEEAREAHWKMHDGQKGFERLKVGSTGGEKGVVGVGCTGTCVQCRGKGGGVRCTGMCVQCRGKRGGQV
jgi:hypothetical protein